MVATKMSLPNIGEYMEFLNFVFRGFWTFSGFFLLGLIGYSVIKAVFDFIVELVHGKPTIINNPEKIIEVPEKIIEAPKTIKKKTRESNEKIDSAVKIEAADVSIIERK